MQPRDAQLLEHILDYCIVIANSLSFVDNSYDLFSNNIDIQQSIAFSILQIGELVGRLSEDLRSSTVTEINWNAIEGMRNIVVHDYGNVDQEEVWTAAVRDTPVLKAFCEKHLSDN